MDTHRQFNNNRRLAPHLQAERLAGGAKGLQPVLVPLPEQNQVVQLPVVEGQLRQDAVPVRLRVARLPCHR